jgi:recombination protein RecA
VGHTLRLKAVKNKVGTPLRETLVDLYYPGTSFQCGFDYIGDLITHAAKQGLLEMSGSWYSLNGEKIANGLANLKTTLRNDTKVLDILRQRLEALSGKDNEVKV